ncbi:hypothetical protein GF389_02135 [Candidatus Dojkabacteria bacterium]|nr:hypothetical protein [Candidatus Dojkabacteria bacterium]
MPEKGSEYLEQLRSDPCDFVNVRGLAGALGEDIIYATVERTSRVMPPQDPFSPGERKPVSTTYVMRQDYEIRDNTLERKGPPRCSDKSMEGSGFPSNVPQQVTSLAEEIFSMTEVTDYVGRRIGLTNSGGAPSDFEWE